MSNDLVKCNNCNWVSFQVSRAYVDAWQKQWNEYWPTLDDEGKAAFGLPDGPPSDREYKACHRCGGLHTNFKDYDGDPDVSGSTINPILNRNEE